VVQALNSFLTALSFLTRFPVRINSEADHTISLSKSITFFPVVGAIIGAITAGVYLILEPYLPRPVLSVIILALPVFVTGGIHFDGLMDTCDGIFSGRSRERSLEIMRDSRIGSMGAIAGILNVMLRYSVLLELPAAAMPVVLIAQASVGRLVMSLALHFFPYARKEGLGQGFAQDKKPVYAIWAVALGLLIIFFAIGIAGLLIALVTITLTLFTAVWVERKLGGLTGDVYGALNEVSENIFLLLFLAVTTSMGVHL
jgi:adenosylcobinamide-GDP ribazoletransferase